MATSTGAMEEVGECTDLLEALMTTTANANKAVVTSLSAVAAWNETERERLEDAIALAKGNITNFSISDCSYLPGDAVRYPSGQGLF